MKCCLKIDMKRCKIHRHRWQFLIIIDNFKCISCNTRSGSRPLPNYTNGFVRLRNLIYRIAVFRLENTKVPKRSRFYLQSRPASEAGQID